MFAAVGVGVVLACLASTTEGWFGGQPTCNPRCMNGGYCVGGYRCQCLAGYTGRWCQTRDSWWCYPRCMNGGYCVGYYGCQCRPGYTGHWCQTRVCSPACRNGGVCRYGICSCANGYSGTYCQVPPRCSPSCRNGGTCIGGNICECRYGYSGLQCQTRECSPACRDGRSCVNGRCSCPSGYTGYYCQGLEREEQRQPATPASAHGRECSGEGCRLRKEIHDMTPGERQLYIDTYKQAYEQGDLDALLQSHEDNFNAGIHTPDQFLPWHRWFILRLENILKNINCAVVMPYWDWSLPSADPWNAPVWSDAYYGGDGGGTCISSGPFQSGQFTTLSRTCLRRSFFGTTPSALVVNDVLSTPCGSFSDFELRLRGELHNTVHCSIGGTMCSVKAAEAPDFFLHHVYIDKLWDDWQKKCSPYNYSHFRYLTSTMTAAGGTAASDMVDLSNQPDGVCVRYQSSQSPSARLLRRMFARVSVAGIAQSVRCTVEDPPASNDGQDLFRVSPAERGRLSQFMAKPKCRKVGGIVDQLPNQHKGNPIREVPVTGGNLGFSLNDLKDLANV